MINTEGVGFQVAKAIDNNDLKKKIFSVCESKNETDETGKLYESYKLKKGKFQLIPNKNKERDTIFICGQAGSGKSYFTAKYAKEYSKMYPKNPIFLFSEKMEDEQLDEIKNLKRVKLDDSLYLNPINYTDFKESLTIFDDVDAIHNKHLRNAIFFLRDKLLKLGRSQKSSVVVTHHTCTGQELKGVLNESNIFIFFMQNYNRALKYLLTEYLGLDKETVKTLRKQHSRWTAFIKSYPNSILTEDTFLLTRTLQD
jgi:hypothetical protein